MEGRSEKIIGISNMSKHLRIFTILLFAKLPCLSQAGFSRQVFHEHFEMCPFTITTKEDIAITLNCDSTINFIGYSSKGDYRDTIAVQISYNGTYTRKGDTVSAMFKEYRLEARSKGTAFVQPTDSLLSGYNRQLEATDAVNFIINPNKIIFIKFPYLKSLEKSTESNIKLLESEFENSGKNIFYPKELF